MGGSGLTLLVYDITFNEHVIGSVYNCIEHPVLTMLQRRFLTMALEQEYRTTSH